MAAYIIATVAISDPEGFAKYSSAIKGLAERFGGEAVVRGAVEEVFEGASAAGERVVVTRFPTADDARAYIRSGEYQEGVRLREGAAVATIRLVVA